MKKKMKRLAYLVITLFLISNIFQKDFFVSLAKDYQMGDLTGKVLVSGDTIINPTQGEATELSMQIEVQWSNAISGGSSSTGTGGDYTLPDDYRDMGSGGEVEVGKIDGNNEKIIGWKVESVDLDTMSVTLVCQTAPLTAYTVTYNDRGTTTETAYEGKDFEIQFPQTNDGFQFMGWKDPKDPTTYTGGESIRVTRNYTFTAKWVAVPPQSAAVGGGTFYMEPGPYTTTLTSGWKVNGGSDGCRYQGTYFYIPSMGEYQFSQ